MKKSIPLQGMGQLTKVGMKRLGILQAMEMGTKRLGIRLVMGKSLEANILNMNLPATLDIK